MYIEAGQSFGFFSSIIIVCHTLGIPRFVTKYDRGGGQNSVTYLMNGQFAVRHATPLSEDREWRNRGNGVIGLVLVPERGTKTILKVSLRHEILKVDRKIG